MTIAPVSTGLAHGYWLTKNSDTPSVLTIALRFALHGPLSRRALGAALTALVERHPALRTRYQRTGDDLRQQVLPPEPVALPVIPVSEEDLEDALLDWSARPFDLDNESGFRPVLFTVTPTHAELLLAIHHAFSDGWSMGVLIRDLGELYRAEVTGTVPDLPPLPADYVEFTRWEREYLADPSTRAMVASWTAEARRAGAEPLLLPTDRPRADRPSRIGAIFETTLPVTMAEVAAAATARRATPFAVLLAVFAALTHDLTGRPVVAPQCAVANRVDARFDNVVGVFTNASWLVIPVADAPSFDDLVTRAVCAVLQRLEVQSVPTPVLKEALGGPFEGTPPRVLFGLGAEPMPSLELHGLTPAPAVEVDLPVSRADQSWAFDPTDDGGLTLRVEYATELFDTTTVAAWTGRFQELLRTGLANPRTAW
ncbi:condensation domain-containing protein [Actinophytocola sp.]|uniref:condensation domain-containing protein n=1 Tax=Actinophytocola sp. TaxID=1872138 RepID=UPI002ED13C9E